MQKKKILHEQVILIHEGRKYRGRVENITDNTIAISSDIENHWIHFPLKDVAIKSK